MDERARLKELERRVRELEMEMEMENLFPKVAAAYFARDPRQRASPSSSKRYGLTTRGTHIPAHSYATASTIPGPDTTTGAAVIDFCTKGVIGYTMNDHYQTLPISQAVRNAVRNHILARGALFHSDRGSNYMSAEYAIALDELGLHWSAGCTGICFENAMAESFFGSLKNEYFHKRVTLWAIAIKGEFTTGPSPVDRRRAGSKHHLITDGYGTPLAVILTGGNRNDVTQLLSLLDATPLVRGASATRGANPTLCSRSEVTTTASTAARSVHAASCGGRPTRHTTRSRTGRLALGG
ncbi:hypothetical protein GCM10023205_52950 [Yinghuangia aomiensis]|uniref:Integrase catalytic domain-containing protein n=1 Tax=Yinghuangia aomiensis TaxID=676205 RepID=A0ABP9HTM3_9ACTN